MEPAAVVSLWHTLGAITKETYYMSKRDLLYE